MHYYIFVNHWWWCNSTYEIFCMNKPWPFLIVSLTGQCVSHTSHIVQFWIFQFWVESVKLLRRNSNPNRQSTAGLWSNSINNPKRNSPPCRHGTNTSGGHEDHLVIRCVSSTGCWNCKSYRSKHHDQYTSQSRR